MSPRAKAWLPVTPTLALVGLALLASVLAAVPAAGQSGAADRREAINPGLGAVPIEVKRASPAATWQSFLDLTRAQRFGAAAHLLDLADVPSADQRRLGAQVAEQLAAVLRTVKARRDDVITEDEAGPQVAGQALGTVLVKAFEERGITGDVTLQRVLDTRNETRWLFSRQVVSSAPFWYRVVVRREPLRGAESFNRGLGGIPPEIRRSNPREAVTGFFDACWIGRFDLAAHFLDLSALRDAEQARLGARLARRLQLALLRSVWIDVSQVSDQPLGTPEPDAPENFERLATVSTGMSRFDIMLAHRWDAELGHVWTFSQPTVAAIDRFYHERGYGWLGDHAPLVMFVINFGGLQLWQWLALLLGLALGLVVARVVGRLLVRVLRRLARRTAAEWDDLAVHAMRGPVGLLIWSLFLLAVAPWLSLTPTAQDIVRHICKLLAIAGVGWFLLRFIDASAERTRRSARPEDQLKVGFLPIVVRFTKAIVVVVVILAALDIVGVKVLAVVTALGLGGVAIAFAAQKTLENVFGTVAIAGDRPFKVGDFIVIGDDRGTVEDVGFRSTRIRTLSRTVVSIPNGLVVSGRVENFAERDRFLFNPTLSVEYRTTPKQLRAVLDGVRALLAAHPRVLDQDRRVRFVQLAASSLDIEVFAYVACTNMPEFLAVAEELNFALLDVVARAGASFAFPTRTIFLNTEQAPSDSGQHTERK